MNQRMNVDQAYFNPGRIFVNIIQLLVSPYELDTIKTKFIDLKLRDLPLPCCYPYIPQKHEVFKVRPEVSNVLKKDNSIRGQPSFPFLCFIPSPMCINTAQSLDEHYRSPRPSSFEVIGGHFPLRGRNKVRWG